MTRPAIDPRTIFASNFDMNAEDRSCQTMLSILDFPYSFLELFESKITSTKLEG